MEGSSVASSNVMCSELVCKNVWQRHIPSITKVQDIDNINDNILHCAYIHGSNIKHIVEFNQDDLNTKLNTKDESVLKIIRKSLLDRIPIKFSEYIDKRPITRIMKTYLLNDMRTKYAITLPF